MDALMAQAARALADGDPFAALKRIALRDEPEALALRGIAMAQLGDLARAKALLRRAAQAFGASAPLGRARCRLAEAEIALVSRDLTNPAISLPAAQAALATHGDGANAAHAGYLEARRLLLIGRLDAAEAMLTALDAAALPQASRPGYWLAAAGIAMRRIRAAPARTALDRARDAAVAARIPALEAEVERALHMLEAPAARLISRDGERDLALSEVEELLASDTLVIDACRGAARRRGTAISLAGRPVLFALVRALAEQWPGDVSREALVARAFRGREADESHRARLRVEMGRLRKALAPLGAPSATRRGFVLRPRAAGSVAVIAPPVEGDHGAVLALLADGEAWSSSALALALHISPRTVQRALEALAAAGKVQSFGGGRACRWTMATVPGFPTSMLLSAPLSDR